MEFKTITDAITVSPQVCPDDLTAIKDAGYRAVICNRPDGEAADQPTFEEIEAAAKKVGLEARYLPIVAGKVSDADAEDFGTALTELPGPVLAYCRTGTRSATLWSLASADRLEPSDILSKTKAAGYDMAGVVRRIVNGGKTPTDTGDAKYDVVIVGGGAAGIAAAASILQRRQGLEIALIDPADIHYYQPGWTMVGGGVFDASTTAKTMGSLIPKGVHWLKSAVAAFEPKDNAVVLDGCRVVKWQERRDIELPLRPGPLYLGAGQGPETGPRDLYPAAHADQMRGRAAEGDVSVRQQLGGNGRSGQDRHRVHECRRRALRCQGLCPGAGKLRRTLWREPQLSPQPDRGGRPCEKGDLQGHRAR
jgi:uncharacterized protein (TIGR01244 family)